VYIKFELQVYIKIVVLGYFSKSSAKEQEANLQKIKDLEDSANKLKEEIEFLQLEVQSKDKEISE
jgi:hypothetical protein